MSAGLNFNLLGQELLLLPEKAIYWQQQKALIVADVHLGKVGHFRKSGFAVPAQLAGDDLVCLTRLIDKCHPEKIWFLGDLFHSDMNADWDAFAAWRRQYDHIQMQLIVGNHDIIDEKHYHELDISTHDELQVGPFLMLHHPQNCDSLNQHNQYVFCGHIHPGVKLVGRGRQSVTLPCFAFGERQVILPSFGKFTGQVSVRHERTDKVFGVLKDRVIEV
ncbi:ligase-associated DNA damage response endonuclease PdeM [Mucilaginibacter sp. Bleaf8]|uniref:ligase-associated DNA damage response endonuclease PdeM n=1 Tax=Mucilaginibacter sp. Bleaf8 TaxID=2834430 RepID=UPI001BD0341B|nr:ligase-associated DNA damage response endonuclease PdeM [Mucilaginibacter sp. Bleaf8]MBS7565928.1 ligase-associated DNA damage response endonuclease PdeM [Mucilaginibacter sp. Bleaf8]